ncbi:hypothetical protein A5906_17385 [Bradyrhizobium sacchari]|nr:hypothetical protein A5906_17385 [Bradyrhizobium sacchari]
MPTLIGLIRSLLRAGDWSIVLEPELHYRVPPLKSDFSRIWQIKRYQVFCIDVRCPVAAAQFLFG